MEGAQTGRGSGEVRAGAETQRPPAEPVEEASFELGLKRWDGFQVAETGKEEGKTLCWRG